MIRLCTHCKKADTEDLEMKYCAVCIVKVRKWLQEQEKPEGMDLFRGHDTRRDFIKAEAIRIYNGKSKKF